MNDHPIEAYGLGGRQVLTGPDHGQIYDHHYVEFTYRNGTKMISQCRHWPRTDSDVSEHASGVKGSSDVSSYNIKLRDGSSWHYRGPQSAPYQVEHDDLFNAIRNNLPYNEAVYGEHSTMTSTPISTCIRSSMILRPTPRISGPMKRFVSPRTRTENIGSPCRANARRFNPVHLPLMKQMNTGKTEE
jgi:hypothetical protein